MPQTYRMVERTCARCKEKYTCRASQAKKGRRYCSQLCAARARAPRIMRAGNPHWKGGVSGKLKPLRK